MACLQRPFLRSMEQVIAVRIIQAAQVFLDMCSWLQRLHFPFFPHPSRSDGASLASCITQTKDNLTFSPDVPFDISLLKTHPRPAWQRSPTTQSHNPLSQRTGADRAYQDLRHLQLQSSLVAQTCLYLEDVELRPPAGNALLLDRAPSSEPAPAPDSPQKSTCSLHGLQAQRLALPHLVPAQRPAETGYSVPTCLSACPADSHRRTRHCPSRQ